MLIEWILELKESIDKHGLRLGVVFTLYAIYRKERRNNRLDKRDTELFHNQLIIMRALGVESEWRGQLKVSNSMEARSLKQLYKLLMDTRRKNKMNQVNLTTLLPGLIGAAKLVLQSFGIDIPDEHINAIVNGAAAVMSVIAIFQSHKKGETNANTKYPTDSGSSV